MRVAKSHGTQRSDLGGLCWVECGAVDRRGSQLLSPPSTAKATWVNHASQADTCFGLTVRELEIVSALAAAYCNKEIAQKLSISEKTVKHHLSNIFAKLGLSTRLELALFAVKHRLPLAHIVTVSQSR